MMIETDTVGGKIRSNKRASTKIHDKRTRNNRRLGDKFTNWNNLHKSSSVG